MPFIGRPGYRSGCGWQIWMVKREMVLFKWSMGMVEFKNRRLYPLPTIFGEF